MNSFYSEEELTSLGFKSVGNNVKLSRKASIYSPDKISIGNNVRIDDFCILSGTITIGSNIHISAYVALYGAMGIIMDDYSGISPKSVVYSAMDDFSGDYLIGPIHPEGTTNVTGGLVRICKYSQIGSNSVVFPNLTIGEGAVIGACSLVNHDVEEWSVNYGVPSQKHKDRSKKLIRFVKEEYLNKMIKEDYDISHLGGAILSMARGCALRERRVAA